MYLFNLQRCLILFILASACGAFVRAQTNPDDDFDLDGVINKVDLDDDNDGVIDRNESFGNSYSLRTSYSFEQFTNFAGTNAVINFTEDIGWQRYSGSMDFWKGPVSSIGSGNDFGVADGTPNSPAGSIFIAGRTSTTTAGEAIRTIPPSMSLGEKYTLLFYQAHAGIDGVTTIGSKARWKVDLAGNVLYSPEMPYQGEGNQTWQLVALTFTHSNSNLSYLTFEADAGTDGHFPSDTNIDYMALDGIYLLKGDFTDFNYALDLDGDGVPNMFDLDSDGDGCSDVNEVYNRKVNPAIFNPKPSLANGKVTANGLVKALGLNIAENDYASTPHALNLRYSFLIGRKLYANLTSGYYKAGENAVITSNVERTKTDVFIGSIGLENKDIYYQWLLSRDNGQSYEALEDDEIYSGTSTKTLKITNVDPTFNDYLFKLEVNTTYNICTEFDTTSITVSPCVFKENEFAHTIKQATGCANSYLGSSSFTNPLFQPNTAYTVTYIEISQTSYTTIDNIMSDGNANVTVSGLKAGQYGYFEFKQKNTPFCVGVYKPSAPIVINKYNKPEITFKKSFVEGDDCNPPLGTIVFDTENLDDGNYKFHSKDITGTEKLIDVVVRDNLGVASSLTAGVYNNIVYKNNGCETTELINVTINVNPNLDCDGDGESNISELNNGTSPSNPCSITTKILPPENGVKYAVWANADCDGDGVTNGVERSSQTDPWNACSFKLKDQKEVTSSEWDQGDCDKDGTSNSEEVLNNTNPLDPCEGGTPPEGAICDVDIENGILASNVKGFETLRIKNVSLYPDNQVIIFNRWGGKVFETNNYNNDTNFFDGTATKGILASSEEKLPSGIYYYVIQFKTDKGNKKVSGHLYIK